MDLAEIIVNDFGGAPVCEHNMPCPVLAAPEKAVYYLSEGYFGPSWKAQAQGWRTVKAGSSFGAWVLDTFFARAADIRKVEGE